ncbi:MAG: hypothetical protein QOJ07_1341, partial [Thermoleophilaceae bacterium]|nr:hypothetical protein [Thermoleophilaceae bacterium]
MRPERRPRLWLGLRGRIVAALVLTSAVTLAAVALALLVPLENRLTRDRVDTLVAQTSGARQSFARLHGRQLAPGSEGLREAARALRRRSGGEVAVYDERGRLLTATDLDTTEATASRGAALQALSSEHTVR